MSLPAGKLNRRVRIEYPVVVRGAQFSDPQTTWQLFGLRWVRIVPLSGREVLRFRELGSETTVRIEMRYEDGITAQMRAVYQDRVYDFDGPPIDVNGERVEMHLMATEHNNG